MKIHHSPTAGDFTIVPNETLRDERLSFAARGHLAYLLSRPDDWRTSSDDEAERARRLRSKRGEGREAMRRIYRELKDAGYIVLVKSVGANGRWTTETHVYDLPPTEVRPADVPESRTSVRPAETASSQVAPRYGKPGVGSPDVGSPDRRLTRTSSTKTVNEEDGPVKTSTQSQDRRGTTPRTPRDQPKTGAGRVVKSGRSKSLAAGAEGDGDSNRSDAAPVKEGSATNSQNRGVRHGSTTTADDAQGFSLGRSDSTTTGTTRASTRHAAKPAALPPDRLEG